MLFCWFSEVGFNNVMYANESLLLAIVPEATRSEVTTIEYRQQADSDLHSPENYLLSSVEYVIHNVNVSKNQYQVQSYFYCFLSTSGLIYDI